MNAADEEIARLKSKCNRLIARIRQLRAELAELREQSEQPEFKEKSYWVYALGHDTGDPVAPRLVGTVTAKGVQEGYDKAKKIMPDGPIYVSSTPVEGVE